MKIIKLIYHWGKTLQHSSGSDDINDQNKANSKHTGIKTKKTYCIMCRR